MRQRVFAIPRLAEIEPSLKDHEKEGKVCGWGPTTQNEKFTDCLRCMSVEVSDPGYTHHNALYNGKNILGQKLTPVIIFENC